MANLLVGDIHGCYDELMLLLEKSKFSSSDILWLTGDLVARGPKSLEVLRFVKQHEQQIRLVLGNHDLHLLSVYAGITEPSKKDHTQAILKAPDCDELMNWLRRQPLVQIDHDLKLIMSHAGITPQWDLQTLIQCNFELTAVLSNDVYLFFLDQMYGNYPDSWSENLQGMDRLRFIANAFTRMRYCYSDGRLDFYCKESPKDVSPKIKPWFDLPRQIPEDYIIAFGHWASLMGKGTPDKVIALDTGCCWGGKLTAFRFEDHQFFRKKNIEAKLKNA